MLAMLAAAAMTVAVAATPAAESRPLVIVTPPADTPACKTNGRYEVADRALLYRNKGRAKASVLGELPKANHEKTVLRTIDGCAAPLVVGYEVGR
ncbi:hypothetical protein [Phenylobacterium sp.]|uniref:hypothetical protein n=1 Tax=Phenylobacterium sp. TaxID=1871053 RepID=UPI0025F40C7F|nr:hypothetical protein [Phenylobacterium sp.]